MSFKTAEQLGVAVPAQWNYVVRLEHKSTPSVRERALKANSYNPFSFPASLLSVDLASDAGSAAMTDIQCASLFRGDEAYGRNWGYFAVLDTVRDIFERGLPRPGTLVRSLIVDERNSTWAPTEADIKSPPSGGFANGGYLQLSRPNFFLVPQQRGGEFLLFRSIAGALDVNAPNAKKFTVVSNGLFDTTEAHAVDNGFATLNIPAANAEPHFGGNIDTAKLEAALKAGNVAIVVMSVTNGRGAGYPSSMANIKEAAKLARAHGVPVVFDAARFAENALAIVDHEAAYKGKPLNEVVKEMFQYCDAFVTGSKRVSNSGAFFCFRDQGLFHKRFSTKKDIGVVIKETQILNFGNDSYGAISGRDLMAMSVGLSNALDMNVMRRGEEQAKGLAAKLTASGIKGVTHSYSAVFLDMDAFFEGEKLKRDDYKGVGFVIELIRLFGVRCSEIGPLTFSECTDVPCPNLVRLAIPSGAYGEDHLAYAAEAIAELHTHRACIPKVNVILGENGRVHLGNTQVALSPVWADGKKL